MEFGEDRETAMAAMIPFAFKENPPERGGWNDVDEDGQRYTQNKGP